MLGQDLCLPVPDIMQDLQANNVDSCSGTQVKRAVWALQVNNNQTSSLCKGFQALCVPVSPS